MCCLLELCKTYVENFEAEQKRTALDAFFAKGEKI